MILMYLLVIIIMMIVILIIRGHYIFVRPMKNIPGPKEYFFLGSALDLLVSPVELFSLARKYAKQFPKVYKFMAVNVVTMNIFNPEDIEKIISTTKNNRKSIMYKFLVPWLKNGLILSKGKTWHDRRKILTPAFHFKILSQFCMVFDKVGQRMVDVLQEKVGEPVNIIPIITELTLTAICETAMGTSLKGDDIRWKKYKDAVFKLGDLFVQRFTNIPLYFEPIFRLTGYWKQQVRALQDLHSFTRHVIQERKEFLKSNFDISEETTADKHKHTPMLDLLIEAEQKGMIDSAGLHEEVDNFMFAGHDTTASTLTFCLMALAQHQHIQENIFFELKDIYDDSTKPASIEDLFKMRYLERCIKESLRLYPPAHFISRVTSEELLLNGHKVPARTMCNIHIYDLHRREDLFPNPELFDPDRFLPENCIGRHPYAYIPFSAGPRNCIGQKYAMLLLKTILSCILRRYKLLPVTKPADIVPTADIILRNSGPVKVMFINRNTK